MEQRLSKATLASLFLSILLLEIVVMPVAKAGDQYITLDPSQGPAGQTVWAYIHGFAEPYVNVTFGETNVGTASIMGDVAHLIIIVPQVSPGVYTVTVRGSTGVASSAFTVTESPYPSPIPTEPTELSEPSPGTPTGSNPANTIATENGEFWSPLGIAIIASAVTVCAALITAVFMKRGKQNTPQYEETSNHEPQPSVPLRTPYAPSKTNQPNTGRQAPSTKICRHCKQTVRDDYNVCPYCLKRLR